MHSDVLILPDACLRLYGYPVVMDQRWWRPPQTRSVHSHTLVLLEYEHWHWYSGNDSIVWFSMCLANAHFLTNCSILRVMEWS